MLVSANRMLRNRNTGVKVPWNPYAAKHPDMDEIDSEGNVISTNSKTPTPKPEERIEATAGPVYSDDDLDEINASLKSAKKKADAVKLAFDSFGMTFEDGATMPEIKKAVRKEIARARSA